MTEFGEFRKEYREDKAINREEHQLLFKKLDKANDALHETSKNLVQIAGHLEKLNGTVASNKTEVEEQGDRVTTLERWPWLFGVVVSAIVIITGLLAVFKFI